MKVKQITPVVHTDISQRKFCYKKGFFLVNLLYLHLIDPTRKETFVGEKFSSQFHSLL